MRKHYEAWEAWITGPANPSTIFPIEATNAKDAKTKASKWAKMSSGTWINITPKGKRLTYYKSDGANCLVLRYR